VTYVAHRDRRRPLLRAGNRLIRVRAVTGGCPVELAHQIAVHCSGGIEVFTELADFAFELAYALLMTVVVGFEFGVALLQLVDERAQGFAAGNVAGGTEVAVETFAKGPDLLGQTASPLLGTGQFRAQALLGD
jgi:hypothetical protein